MCKYSDVFSLAVLIGRGLDLESQKRSETQILVFSFEGALSTLNELCTISSVGRAPDS